VAACARASEPERALQAFERHLASDLASPGRGQARPALTAVMNAFARRGDLATLAALQRRADEAGVPLYTERVNAMLLGCREVGDAAEAVRQYEACCSPGGPLPDSATRQAAPRPPSGWRATGRLACSRCDRHTR